MEHIKITNTPYDDVFRTLLNDCSSLILPVINEMFGEHYSGQETIIFSPNEHFLNQQGGNEDERITDTSFKIEGKCTKKYNLLKAIKAARRSAATPAFLLCKKIVTAAAKLCRVCPDGKEYSPGGGINSTISLSKA